ncbi:hypothetical protein Tco_1006989 [Tanacetum coccineum]|uniref:Uncharacterized protein n=1 Tax=Tanacetum coccineum TaxID=301880 RepID=A0ABQ5FJB5_9ASTR
MFLLFICKNFGLQLPFIRQKFEDLPLEHDILSFIRDLGHTRDITYLTDVNVDYLHQPWRAFATVINKCLSGKETRMDKIHLLFLIENKDAKKTNEMSYPRFTNIIIDHFMSKDQSISRRNKMFWHTTRDDTMFTSMRCISRHEDTQKADPDTSPKQKLVQATKGTRLKSKAKVAKPDTKKQPAKKTKAKGLTVLSEVALTKAGQLKLDTKRSKTQFHSSHVSGSGDGVDTQSKVPDEQQQKSSGTDEGTCTIPGVPDVPIYEFESEKESWGDSDDEDNENYSDDVSDEGDYDNDGNDDDDDANDDDKQEGDDTNDDDEETDSDRTESDRIKIPVLDQSTTEFYEEEEEEEYDDEFNIKEDEKIDDEETMYDDEDDEVTKELYEDVNVNLGNEATKMTNADQGASEQQNKADEPVQSSSVSSNFTSKLLNLENPSAGDNEIALLMETSARHATVVPENTSGFTTTIPPPPRFFNPLLQQATPTPTPTNFEATTSFPSLLDFSFYAQALSPIPTIVDRYMDNKLGEAINKAILAHNLDCRQEAQDEKNAYIELIDTSMRALIKEEVNTQLPQILPQAVSDFANPVIDKNVTESVEATVLTRSSSQPTSTYEAAASLSEFELTKILIDKMEKNKSYDKVDYRKKLYDALVESYNTDKGIFDSYGEVLSLKKSRDEKDKDRDPFAGSDRGTKRRKSSKDAESSRDSRSKEKKSSSTSKDASQSQHKSSGKSAHAEEPNHTVEDSGMQQDQEFVTEDNDEQPADKEVTKADWFKKPERPPTPDHDWSKRQQVDFRPPQTWISQVAHAEEPPTSFDFKI